jgi:septal ring factor EnvC (AmiA/AmiB activator)
MIYYNYILVSNLIFYGMIIFREMHAASAQTQDLIFQLKLCQLKLRAANSENEKLNVELNFKSKQNKQLEDDLKCMDHEKRSLQQKVSNLENALFSLSGRNPSNSANQRLLLERPILEEVRRPKLTDLVRTTYVHQRW